METLSDQFEAALSRIEITGKKRERAVAAQAEIREHLEGDDVLRGWGVDTVLIGSYARHTSIRPGKDVDVFTKLPELDTTANPSLVFETVRAVLVAKYGERAKPQARSIKVSFDEDGDDFAVDVVPAVRMRARWGIPRRDTSRWADPDPDARWVETDPEHLGELTIENNRLLTVDGRGAYVPTVKLVRQTRRHHRGDAKPGGFYFELLSYWAFRSGATDGDSFAEIFATTLGAIAAQLADTTPLIDPVLNRPYKPEPDPNDRADAQATFTRLAAMANRALSVGRCPAAALWREILGTNDLGPCFPLPPGCDEDGNEIKRIAPVAATGSREASGFA